MASQSVEAKQYRALQGSRTRIVRACQRFIETGVEHDTHCENHRKPYEADRDVAARRWAPSAKAR